GEGRNKLWPSRSRHFFVCREGGLSCPGEAVRQAGTGRRRRRLAFRPDGGPTQPDRASGRRPARI
ncbi:MAG: hypothetical protein J6336_12635, partial [Kiritimatiellae bacterium]|nr:hypothetical protein [Kiritimatiellia bacterium]